MAKIVVVYHSGYGHTMRMAQSVAEGASATLIAIDGEGNCPKRLDALNAAMPLSWAARLTWVRELAVQEVCRCVLQTMVHQQWKTRCSLALPIAPP